MSNGVQGDKRRKTSGRVTPSKLRRSAVIAVDGVLAIGTGAIGGLFATGAGDASAAAPTPGWTPFQAPLPSSAANPSVTLQSESCVSAVFCGAAGSYRDPGGNTHGLLEVYSGGTWSATDAPLPSNFRTNQDTILFSIDCPSVGSCVAVGGYKNSSGGTEGVIDTFSAGHWTSAEAPLPSGALTGGSADGFQKSVSCPTTGTCVSTGFYSTAGGSVGLIDTLTGGQWSGQMAPQPSDADAHQQVELADVSCPSVGTCVAAGRFVNSLGGTAVEALQQSGSSWTAAPAPVPGDAVTGASEDVELPFQSVGLGIAISCATTGTCLLIGRYANSTGGRSGLLDSLNGGVWTAASAPLPGNSATGASQSVDMVGVSCPAIGGCVAVGAYSGNGTRPLIESVTGGVPTAQEGPQPSDATGTPNAFLTAVSCLTGTACTAVGQYRDNSGSGNGVAFVDMISGGAWSTLRAPNGPGAQTGTSEQSLPQAVSCTSRGACDAAGLYYDTSSNRQGLLESYTPPEGYWTDASDGGIFTYGNAVFHGSMGGQHLNAPMVGMAQTPGPGGYWEVGSDGGIFSFGNAVFHGSTGSLVLNAPIVGMAATPDGGGYWLVATDGGIFNYGDAGFYGSAGSIRLNKPIVGMAPTPDGHGYWLVASDGGIFTYGDAVFYGSRGGQPLNKPIVGMAADASGLGYWLVASDGGIFTYGDAVFHGSSGSIVLNKPIVGMMSSFDGNGYWLVASDGGIFSYGDTGFEGSAGSLHLNAPMVGGTPT